MISHNAMKKFWLNCILLSIMHSQLKLDLPSIFSGRFRKIESNQLYVHILLQLQWFGHWHYRLCDSSINRFICNILRFLFFFRQFHFWMNFAILSFLSCTWFFNATTVVLSWSRKYCNFTFMTMVVPLLYQQMIWRIDPTSHNFENCLPPRFVSQSCLGLLLFSE